MKTTDWTIAARMDKESGKRGRLETMNVDHESPKRRRFDDDIPTSRSLSSSPSEADRNHNFLSNSERAISDFGSHKQFLKDVDVIHNQPSFIYKRRHDRYFSYIDAGRHTESPHLMFFERDHEHEQGVCYQQTHSTTQEHYTEVMFPPPPTDAIGSIPNDPAKSSNFQRVANSYNKLNTASGRDGACKSEFVSIQQSVKSLSPPISSNRIIEHRNPASSPLVGDVGQMYVATEGDDTVSCSVNGLLNLPGSNEKRYEVTVGELKRRIAAPECLNKVDMISYVRLAKQSARELLERYGIRPKHHSRKSKHSILSKMCEAECQQLAEGLQDLSGRYFPKDWLARRSVKVLSSDIDDDKVKILRRRYEEIEIARSVLFDLGTSINSSRQDKEMQVFDLVTHTYGLKTLLNHIDLISTTLEAQLRYISSLCHGN